MNLNGPQNPSSCDVNYALECNTRAVQWSPTLAVVAHVVCPKNPVRVGRRLICRRFRKNGRVGKRPRARGHKSSVRGGLLLPLRAGRFTLSEI